MSMPFEILRRRPPARRLPLISYHGWAGTAPIPFPAPAAIVGRLRVSPRKPRRVVHIYLFDRADGRAVTS